MDSLVVGMRSPRWLCLTAVLACVLASVSLEPAHAEEPAQVVEVTATAVPEVVGPGATAELTVSVTIAPGWHVNAHIPSEPYLIPTHLTINAPPEVETGEVRYPEGEKRAFAFNPGKPLATYEGTITLTVPLRVRREVTGDHAAIIRGTLRYQACNDTRCLRPWTLPVFGRLHVRKELTGAAREPAATLAAGTPGTATMGGFASEWIERGNVFTYLGAFVLGLLLNLTPCVYPLIAVTLAFFGGQGRADRMRVIGLAAVYVLGITVTFSTLGVASAVSGSAFGMALQRPVVLVAIAAVLLALAASSFGLYRFRVPAALDRWAGRSARGFGGALFMGLTMGVVAAPCVGPVLAGLILIVGTRQEVLFGFSLFFVLSLGLGAPYVILATLASAARGLPRSGAWLAWMEKLLGFVLVGLALFYVGPLLPVGVRRATHIGLLVLAGVYLGFLDSAGAGSLRFVRIRRGVGVAALAVALWSVGTGERSSPIRWQPFTPQALAAARHTRTPTVVDFTAEWCIPCREMKSSTFRRPAVAEAARAFAMLRADVTVMDADTDEILQGQGVLGVPTYLFFTPEGEEAQRLVGFVPWEEFLRAMKAAAEG